MDLIPLPYEPVLEPRTAPLPSKDFKGLLMEKLRVKAQTQDHKLIKATCKRIFKYLENSKEHDLSEVSDLLTCLERSIITIQRHKKDLVEEQNSKIKNKRNRNKK